MITLNLKLLLCEDSAKKMKTSYTSGEKIYRPLMQPWCRIYNR